MLGAVSVGGSASLLDLGEIACGPATLAPNPQFEQPHQHRSGPEGDRDVAHELREPTLRNQLPHYLEQQPSNQRRP
jgi:hypothetical protein